MKLYIVRHGETDWNHTHRLQGSTDIPLNDYGRELAKKTADGLHDIPFTKVISSPLCRAVETAEIILSDRSLPITFDDRLKEISFGEYEGLSHVGESRNIPDDKFFLFFTNPDQYIPPKGGETIRQLCDRTSSFMNELIHNDEYQDDIILLTVHGAVIRSILNHFENHPSSDFWAKGVPPNCATTIIDVQNKIPVIIEESKVFY